jgi:hypothetical protein
MTYSYDNPKELFVDNEASPKAGAAVAAVQAYYASRQDYLGACTHGSIHLQWTGTPTGTFSLWSSNDAAAELDTDVGWIEETGISVPAQPAGSAGATMVHIFHSGARWLRVKYAHTSGTGSIRGLGIVKA